MHSLRHRHSSVGNSIFFSEFFWETRMPQLCKKKFLRPKASFVSVCQKELSRKWQLASCRKISLSGYLLQQIFPSLPLFCTLKLHTLLHIFFLFLPFWSDPGWRRHFLISLEKTKMKFGLAFRTRKMNVLASKERGGTVVVAQMLSSRFPPPPLCLLAAVFGVMPWKGFFSGS